MIEVLPPVIAGLLIVQYAVLLLLLKTNWKQQVDKIDSLPTVSVLIAARNEEERLPKLLESLGALDYPSEKLELLVADDQSTDRTADLTLAWAEGFPNRKLVSVRPEQLGIYQQNGKANALAILAQQASGEIFFFTDADCVVPPTWVKEGVRCIGGQTGIVIGVTQVRDSSIFGGMQELEWWNTLGIVKAVTDLRLPTTGMGNNMVISRTAYLASGGFEGVRSSVTEDLEISRSIARAGFGIHHQISADFLVATKAEKDWPALLKQRKRWVSGTMTLSLGWKILMGLQFLFFPAIIILMGSRWEIGLGLWSAKVFFQSWFLRFFAQKAGKDIGLFRLIFFDFYQIASFSLTILYYFWPSKVEWKSRNYP